MARTDARKITIVNVEKLQSFVDSRPRKLGVNNGHFQAETERASNRVIRDWKNKVNSCRS